MQILLSIIILLLHSESGDVDIVKSCYKVGDTIVVDLGWDAEEIEFPANEYECKVLREADEER